jgi:UDP-2,3-diacylglucosamine hydrolase
MIRQGADLLSGTVYLLSDTHFKYHKNDEQERKKRLLFLEFLESIHGADRLYLVGDIFDFWFEYRSVIPRYYGDIIGGLLKLREGGTRIFITGGNHDHWLGSYLPDTIDASVIEGGTIHELQGRKVLLTHGDTLIPGDVGYKTLKSIIRSGPVVSLAKLLHPDILFALAGLFSKTSKGITHRKTKRYAEKLAAIAEERFFSLGNDSFVMGHIHFPVMRRFEGKVFIILGDWETHFSYARLENGSFSLESYQREGNTLIENL